MHHHLSVFDVLTHASHESLMILPYLFIAYLILEYLERKTQNVSLFFADLSLVKICQHLFIFM